MIALCYDIKMTLKRITNNIACNKILVARNCVLLPILCMLANLSTDKLGKDLALFNTGCNKLCMIKITQFKRGFDWFDELLENFIRDNISHLGNFYRHKHHFLLVFVREEDGGYGAIPLGDDPDAPIGMIGGVIDTEQAVVAGSEGVIVELGILGTAITPVSVFVAGDTLIYIGKEVTVIIHLGGDAVRDHKRTKLEFTHTEALPFGLAAKNSSSGQKGQYQEPLR